MKVVRLKERDIQRMVKRVIKEDTGDKYLSGPYDKEWVEKIMLVRELQDEIDELMSVIPYTETKDEAYDIQEDILELEDRVNGLQWEIENNLRESDIKCITKRVLNEQLFKKKDKEVEKDEEFCSEFPNSVFFKGESPDQAFSKKLAKSNARKKGKSNVVKEKVYLENGKYITKICAK